MIKLPPPIWFPCVIVVTAVVTIAAAVTIALITISAVTVALITIAAWTNDTIVLLVLAWRSLCSKSCDDPLRATPSQCFFPSLNHYFVIAKVTFTEFSSYFKSNPSPIASPSDQVTIPIVCVVF